MSSFYRSQLEAWLKLQDVKADRVLDFGGSQLPIKDRVRSWDVKEYKILDLEQPHKVKQQPDIVMDLNGYIDQIQEVNDVFWNKYNGQLEQVVVDKYGQFDISFCLEVMEYILHPSKALYYLNCFTKKGGILYITFPWIYPVHEPIEQDYLRYTKRGAFKLLEEAGFKVESCFSRHTVNASLREFYSKEGMRAAKGYDGHEDIGFIIKARKV